MNMFNLNCTCVRARDAWEKLQIQCEGSASVKKIRMLLLTSNFEKLRMEESEPIMKYNTRLKILANEAPALGDPISNERLVFKILRSVPKRFHTKCCAIDESKDTSIMGLDELISSLRNFEKEMEVEDDYKGNSIAFQVSNDTYNDFSEMKQEVKEFDLGDDSIALITKKFGDYLKINPLGVGSGVATPGSNTVQKSVCFVASNFDNSNYHEEKVLALVLHNTKSNTDKKRPTTMKIWVPKTDVKCFVIYTSLKANTAENWYLDSGSSRHMTGLKDHLMDYIEQISGRVTYGGGAKGRIFGKRTLNVKGFPKLHNVQDHQTTVTNLVKNWFVDTQKSMILVYGTKSLVM
ncbi:uncharacterized protein [Henckelia pumila]|uniref:uncharacterized protein n=1 Tax=Henckelia pumila TaxID=405737 RepID=UPI003C6DFA21